MLFSIEFHDLVERALGCSASRRIRSLVRTVFKCQLSARSGRRVHAWVWSICSVHPQQRAVEPVPEQVEIGSDAPRLLLGEREEFVEGGAIEVFPA